MVIAIIVPIAVISIISTVLLCTLFFWVFVRKYSRGQQQAPLQVTNSIPSISNCDEQHEEEHKIKQHEEEHKIKQHEEEDKIKQNDENSARKSEHIYSIPRWSNEFDMSYNEAYDSAFSISINAAYSSILQHQPSAMTTAN